MYSPNGIAVLGGSVVVPAIVLGEQTRVAALLGRPGAELEVITVDDGAGFPAPDGYRSSAPQPSDVASDGSVLVMVGHHGLSIPSSIPDNGWLGVAAGGAIWRSTDGRTWERLDPMMDALAGGTTALRAVAATPAGFVAVGYAAELDGWAAPSHGLILTSDDGTEWRRTELSLPYSVELTGVAAIADRLVVWGTEYVCIDHAPSVNAWTPLGEQLRAWFSDDRGTTWQQVALLDVPALSSAAPPPADPAGCPTTPQLVDEQYLQRLAAVGVAGGEMVVWGTDRSTVATTSDLETWTISEVRGARPEHDPVDEMNDSAWSGLITDERSPVLVSIEPARDDTGARRLGEHLQVLGWQRGGGGRWEPLPATRPVSASSQTIDLRQAGNDAILFNGSVARWGTAAPFEPWGTCDDPESDAQCQFATVVGADWSSAHLTGVDLAGAVLRAVNLSGAEMNGASLAGVLLDDVDLSGATLSGADLTRALIGRVDLAAADLSGADLSGAQFDAYYSVYSGEPVDLRGVDFASAVLRGATFSRVDLTSANLMAADLGGDITGSDVVFGNGVICPDGAPPADSASGRAACRL
ncbi:MAG: pentapeptide repeat-containing protein [Ilumatobacteraceae bacterium]